jgi:FixJ family two-component response regulator
LPKLDATQTRSPVVYVVDSDASVRHALGRLISSVRLEVKAFGTAREFLQWQRPDAPSCLILDVRLTDGNGLDLKSQLADAKIHISIIFVTAYGDVFMSVKAMKAGAVDFLTKPYRDQDVLDAIHRRAGTGPSPFVLTSPRLTICDGILDLSPGESVTWSLWSLQAR